MYKWAATKKTTIGIVSSGFWNTASNLHHHLPKLNKKAFAPLPMAAEYQKKD